MSTQLLNTDTPIIHLDESRRFITDCMLALGTPKPNAKALADLLAEADYRGHYSHGMNRIELYLNEIENGVCKPDAIPEILKETSATAWVEGHNGLGVVTGTFGMDLAIEKAKQVGIGFVVCKGSNHFGIAGMYALQAMKKGFIGLSFTNTCPVVAPTRAKHGVIGTNPLSVAASGHNGDSFVLDMATSAVALGKIEMKMRRNSEVPSRWANLETNVLYPLGGDELNSSYKGYGLAVLVELFCGVLGGGCCGPKIRDMNNFTECADLGHCFIAIDPTCFAPGFEDRLSDLMALLRNTEPVDLNKPVMVAGDTERLHMKAVDTAGGVRYVQDQLDTCQKVATKLKVKPLQFCSQ